MNPISNQMFSDDYQRFVLQTPHCHIVHKMDPPPFKIKSAEKSQKSKKDIGKQKKEKEEKENPL